MSQADRFNQVVTPFTNASVAYNLIFPVYKLLYTSLTFKCKKSNIDINTTKNK